MGDDLDLLRDRFVGERRFSRGRSNTSGQFLTGLDGVPYRQLLFRVKVDLIYEVLPRLGDDAGVLVVGCVVDEETEVKIACLVGVVVVELREHRLEGKKKRHDCIQGTICGTHLGHALDGAIQRPLNFRNSLLGNTSICL